MNTFNGLHINLANRYRLAGLVSVLLITSILYYSNVYHYADIVVLDSQFQIIRSIAPREVEKKVVVVGIDEDTMNEYPQPFALWHTHLANLFQALAISNPVAVGSNIILPSRSVIARYDNELLLGLKELRDHGIPTILTQHMSMDGKLTPIYPLYVSFVGGSENIGADFLVPDIDKVVRRHTENIDGVKGAVPTFVGQLIRRLGHDYQPGIIDYTVADEIEYLPMHSVINLYQNNDNDTLRSLFEDKVVLIGSVLGDKNIHYQPFPVASWHPTSKTPGVLIHALAARSLLSRGLIQPFPDYLRFLLPIISIFVIFSFKNLNKMFIAIIGLIIFLTMGSIVFLFYGKYFAISSTLITILIASVARWYSEYRLEKRQTSDQKLILQTKKDLIDKLSHDLRTPAMTIVGACDLVNSSTNTQDKNKYLAIIQQAADHIHAQVDALLNIHNTSFNKHFDLVEFDLYKFIYDIHFLVLPLAENKDIGVKTFIDLGLNPLRVGPGNEIKRVLLNMISNAIKYSSKGNVRVHVLPSDISERHVRVEVKDDGKGISEDMLSDLFLPYVQGDKNGSDGIGLGAAISKQLVEKMGGKIGVNSSVGKGSTFWVEIPLLLSTDSENKLTAHHVRFNSQDKMIEEKIMADFKAFCSSDLNNDNSLESINVDVSPYDETYILSLHSHSSVLEDLAGNYYLNKSFWLLGEGGRLPMFSNNTYQHLWHMIGIEHAYHTDHDHEITPDIEAHLLIVDDAVDVRYILEELLQAKGYHVDAAGSGQEALAMVAKQNYDLVILDYHIPDINGVEIAKRIKSNYLSSETPVLLLSADANLDEIESHHIIDKVVSKPIRGDALYNIVYSLIKGKTSKNVIDLKHFEDRKILSNIRGVFQVSAEESIDQIIKAAKSGDANSVRSGLHKLKGSAVYIGADILADYCEELYSSQISSILVEPSEFEKKLRQHVSNINSAFTHYMGNTKNG